MKKIIVSLWENLEDLKINNEQFMNLYSEIDFEQQVKQNKQKNKKKMDRSTQTESTSPQGNLNLNLNFISQQCIDKLIVDYSKELKKITSNVQSSQDQLTKKNIMNLKIQQLKEELGERINQKYSEESMIIEENKKSIEFLRKKIQKQRSKNQQLRELKKKQKEAIDQLIKLNIFS